MEVILREHGQPGRRGRSCVAMATPATTRCPVVALLVTEGNKQQIERERGKFEAKEQEEKKVADAMAARLVGVEIQIARKVGETEVLFGSVTSADIAAAMAAKGFEIDRRKLNLREPIKKLGEYDVPLRLHLDVTVPVKVKVVAEGSDKGKTQS